MTYSDGMGRTTSGGKLNSELAAGSCLLCSFIAWLTRFMHMKMLILTHAVLLTVTVELR